METSRLVRGAMDATRVGQAELALALNVSQAAVSQWQTGRRQPSGEFRERLARAVRVVPYSIEPGPWIKPIILPDQLWDAPAFKPRGNFRLPEHINWSGTRELRTFNAEKLNHVLYSYTLVITNGRASDFARWIDPLVLREHFDQIGWSRGWREAWERRLNELESTFVTV